MAIINTSTQYSFTGRGPLDPKALVKTYAELLSPATWDLENGTRTAYNGMVTAVWLNTEDPSKNGIYFLHDENVTSARKAPDVTLEPNWHKIGGLDKFSGSTDDLTALVLATEANAKKLAGIETTVTDYVASLIGATGSTLKASDEISIAEDGTLGIKALNVNKLVQTLGDTLVLSGGTATI